MHRLASWSFVQKCKGRRGGDTAAAAAASHSVDRKEAGSERVLVLTVTAIL